MFRHVVLFRWAESATEEQKQRARDAVASLPGQIPEIRRFVFGSDAGLAEGNYDFALVADFAGEAGYRTYANHPVHQAVLRDVIRPVLAERAAVQYVVSDAE